MVQKTFAREIMESPTRLETTSHDTPLYSDNMTETNSKLSNSDSMRNEGSEQDGMSYLRKEESELSETELRQLFDQEEVEHFLALFSDVRFNDVSPTRRLRFKISLH